MYSLPTYTMHYSISLWSYARRSVLVILTGRKNFSYSYFQVSTFGSQQLFAQGTHSCVFCMEGLYYIHWCVYTREVGQGVFYLHMLIFSANLDKNFSVWSFFFICKSNMTTFLSPLIVYVRAALFHGGLGGSCVLCVLRKGRIRLQAPALEFLGYCNTSLIARLRINM